MLTNASLLPKNWFLVWLNAKSNKFNSPEPHQAYFNLRKKSYCCDGIFTCNHHIYNEIFKSFYFLYDPTHLLNPFLLEASMYGPPRLKVQLHKLRSTDKRSFTCFQSILKISYSNYSQFYSNLSVKFAIFLKSSLFFNSFYCFLCL